MKTPIKIVLIYLFIQLCVGLLINVLITWAGILGLCDRSQSQSIALAPSLLISMAIMFYYLYHRRYIPFTRSAWSPVSMLYLFFVLLIGSSSIVIVDCVSSFTQWIPDLMDQTFDVLQSGVLGIICITLLGPVLEELLFRGAVTRLLLTRYKPRKAVLISALMFGIFHLNPAQILPAFLIGLVLAQLYYRTKSLIPGILIHILNNSATVYLCIKYPHAKQFSDITSGVPYIMLVIGALILFIFSWYAMHRLSEERLKNNGE